MNLMDLKLDYACLGIFSVCRHYGWAIQQKYHITILKDIH